MITFGPIVKMLGTRNLSIDLLLIFWGKRKSSVDNKSVGTLLYKETMRECEML